MAWLPSREGGSVGSSDADPVQGEAASISPDQGVGVVMGGAEAGLCLLLEARQDKSADATLNARVRLFSE
jgi:hypothetical protein